MPLISNWLRFWLPVAWRAASKLATAPPENRARNNTASSTVTSPICPPPARPQRLARGAGELLPLLDEGLGDGPGDFGDFLAGDEAGHVDDVGVQVAVGARAGQLLVEPPEQGHGFAGPILEIRGPDVADLADLALTDQLVGEGHGRAAAVVEPDEGLDAVPLGGLDHFAGVLEGAGDRLFAADRLAGGDGGLGHGGVHVVGRHHVDQPDQGRLDQFFPVGRAVLPAPIGGEARVFLRQAVDRVHDRDHGRLEELGHLSPCVGMGTAHEALADESDVDGFHSGLL